MTESRRRSGLRGRPVLALALTGLALTTAACGGAAKSSGSKASGDVATILSSIDTQVSSSAQKVNIHLAYECACHPNAALGELMQKPTDVRLAGVVDPANNRADLSLTGDIGKTPVDERLLFDGSKSWLQTDDKWYVLSPTAIYESSFGLFFKFNFSNVNAGTSLALTAIGNPAEMFDNPTATADEVDGVATDKVSGELNLKGALGVLARSEATLESTAPTPAQLDETAALFGDSLKHGQVDLWVGSSDHRVHRIAIEIDAAMDAATQEKTGVPLDTLHLTIDGSTVDTDAPDITEPSPLTAGDDVSKVVQTLLDTVLRADA